MLALNRWRDRLQADPCVAAVAPTVTKAWVDGGYDNAVVEHGADLGIDVEVVRPEPQTCAFTVGLTAGARSWEIGQVG